MVDRLWLFLYLWVFIFAFVFLSAIRLGTTGAKAERLVTRIVTLLIAVVLILSFRNFPDYGAGAEWTLVPGNQANPLIAYVQKNIQPGETLYSYAAANLIVEYKNGYNNDTIGNGSTDNIIWGTPLSSNPSTTSASVSAEVSRITNTAGAYVLFYHCYPPLSGDPFPDMITTDLQKAGYMDLVLEDYYTPLYWFTQDMAKVKAAAHLDAPSLMTTQGTISGTFVLTNTGKTVFSADGYGSMTLTISRPGDDGPPVVSVPFGQEILPGGTGQIDVDVDGLAPGTYDADVVFQDEYSLSQLGTAPMTIEVT
ncbi:MAG: hypothetical protein FWF36_00760 [Propionibacteriaceae bacterium]|nr:hypothetical protein [Propionibacteriaceae bacterium]